MTQTPPPERPPSSRRPLNSDDLIGILVAFTSIGAIFFWSITRDNKWFDFSIPEKAAAPQPSPFPLVNNSPAPSPAITASPAPAPAPSEIAPVEQPAARTVPLPVPVPAQPASPAPSPSPTSAPGFSDVPSNYWAAPFLEELARRNVIARYQDGTFQPDKPISRAEFARMVQQAFDRPQQRQASQFSDVPSGFWAADAINRSVQMGFMNGYPNNVFRPDQVIPKFQALIALATGLGLAAPQNPTQTLGVYQDANQLPSYASSKVAAATSAGIVVNHPDLAQLKPNQDITRADAAALIYQALVYSGKAEKINSPYIVPNQP